MKLILVAELIVGIPVPVLVMLFADNVLTARLALDEIMLPDNVFAVTEFDDTVLLVIRLAVNEFAVNEFATISLVPYPIKLEKVVTSIGAVFGGALENVKTFPATEYTLLGCNVPAIDTIV